MEAKDTKKRQLGIFAWLWRRGTVLLVFSIFAFYCHGQTVAELRNQLIGNIPDTLRASILEDLAWQYRNVKVDSTRYFAVASMQLGNKAGQKRTVAYALTDLGFYYRAAGKLDSAHICLEQSQILRDQVGNPRDIASGRNQMGLLLLNEDRIEEALVVFKKGLKELKGTKEYKSAAFLEDGLGQAYLKRRDFPNAIAAFQRSLSLNELIDDSIAVAKSLQNIGIFFQETGRSEMALASYQRALDIYERNGLDFGIAQILMNKGMILNDRGQSDAALTCLRRAEQVADAAGNSLLLNDIYNDLALIYKKIGVLDIAEKYHRLDFQNSTENGLTQKAIIAAINLAELYGSQGKHTDALAALSQAEDLGGIPKHLQSFVYSVRASAYAGLGNFEAAFEWTSKQRILEDSISNAMTALQEISDKYLHEKANHELTAQAARVAAAKLAQAEAEGSKKTLIILGFLVMLVLVTIVGLFYGRNQQLKIRTMHAEAQVADEKALNQARRTEIQGILQEAELKALRLSMETQQRERNRIASNLHDRLGSKLSVVQWLFQSLGKYKTSLPEKAQEKYSQGITFIDEACAEVRNIARNMQSGDLAHFGLQMALERFCDQVRLSCDLTMEFNAFGSPRRLSAELEGEIYAIVRTLIENVLRHAKATHCTVQLHYANDSLQITIEDDGRGFDVASANQGPGIGLKNVRQRVETQEGQLTLESKPSMGTWVAISFPIQMDENNYGYGN